MKKQTHKTGTVLITLLFFVAIAITITSAAVAVTISNSLGASKIQDSTLARDIAEGGAENALLRLLRNPTSYTGETLTINGGTATITVTTNGSTRSITSVGKLGNFTRTIQITTSYTNNVMTISSWKETF